MGCPCIKSIQISASNLVSFNYVGVKTNLFLENVPSLVDVRIGDGMVTSYFGGSMNDSFSLLSCCLKTLTLKPGIVVSLVYACFHVMFFISFGALLGGVKCDV